MRPEYYGILLFTLAGPGTLYRTTVSAGALNVTAYAILTASGGLNLIINNQDPTNNLALSVQVPTTPPIGSLLQLTQLTTDAAGPSLTATTGVTLQGAEVDASGTFTPADPYLIAVNGNQLDCYVPALSAVLLKLS